MKNQILTLVIGILIGAAITTGVFLLLKGNDKKSIPTEGRKPQITENGETTKRNRPSKGETKKEDTTSNSSSNSNSNTKSEN